MTRSPLPPAPLPSDSTKVQLICPYCEQVASLCGLVPKGGEFEIVFVERNELLPWRKQYYAMAQCPCHKGMPFRVYMTRDQARRFDSQEQRGHGKERNGWVMG